MNVAVFSAKRYDRDFLDAANASAGHRLTCFDVPLEPETATLAAGHEAVCIFVNDKADADVLEALSRGGTRLISLHCPLTPETHHIINKESLGRAKRGAILINTSRGGLVDTGAVIEALKSGQLGGLAIDVYEQEADIFFRDLSSEIIPDDVFQRLLAFPNVIVTGHQAFFTREAISTICETTIRSISKFAAGQPLSNEIMANAP